MGGRVLTSSKLTKVILHTSWTSKCERSGPLEHGRKCAVVGYSTRRGTRHAGAWRDPSLFAAAHRSHSAHGGRISQLDRSEETTALQ